MNKQSMYKLASSGLFVFALSLLFFQNNQLATETGILVEKTNYSSVYQSNALAVNSRSTDSPGQSCGDRCSADKSR